MTDDDLERRLQAFRSEQQAGVGPPPTPVLAAVRPRWILPALAAAAASVAIAVAGVLAAGAVDDPASTPVLGSSPSPFVVDARPVKTVPWAALPPGPYQKAVPFQDRPARGAMRSCESAELQAERAGSDGAGGTNLEHFLLRPRHSGLCWLSGRLDGISGVQDGKRTDVPLLNNNTPAGHPGVISAEDPGILTLYVGGRCDTAEQVQNDQQAPLTALKLTLLGGELDVLPGDGAGDLDLRCGPQVTATALGIRYPGLGFMIDPRSRLVASITAPDSAIAGQALRYEVVLTNPSRSEISLDPCPSYEQSLGTYKTRFRLNCANAVPIGSGSREVFVMQLAVPANAKAGASRLRWSLAGADLPSVETDIQVVPAAAASADTRDGVKAGPTLRLRETDEFGLVVRAERRDSAIRIAVDRVDSLTGEEAAKAAADDGTDVSNDHYEVNDSPRTREYVLSADPDIWQANPSDVSNPKPMTVEQWLAYATSDRGRIALFHFDVEDGLVVGIEEQYFP